MRRFNGAKAATVAAFHDAIFAAQHIVGPWNRQVRCEEEVKTTRYFEHMRKRPDRRMIRDEWISYVIETPEKTEVQADGRIRKWAWISEEGKFLRVVLLEDGETVHNVFFDRSFKESRK